jgi:hypothetical protein
VTIDPNVLDRYKHIRRCWHNMTPPAESLKQAQNYCDYHVFNTKTVRFFGLLVGRTDHDPGDEDRNV